MLIYFFYVIGKFLTNGEELVNTFENICILTGIGFFSVVALVCAIIEFLIFFEYLEKGNILSDLKKNISCVCKFIAIIFKIPKKIYNRIKSEPEQFKSALNEEMSKQK